MRTRLAVLVGFAVLVGACANTGTDTTTTVGVDPSTPLTSAAPTTTVVVTTTSIVQLPTADEIVADGEVTDQEREVARQAVFECLVDVGADTTFELFDIDPVVQRDYPDRYQDCLLEYTGIYRRNEFPGDRFNLGLLGVVECTEDRTGKYYGRKTVDEIGRLTDESRETIFEAISQDEKAYEECLGLVHGFDSIAWSRTEDGEVVRIYDDNIIWGSFVEYRFDDNDPKRISLKLAECGYSYDAWLIEETASVIRVQAVTIENGDGEPCWLRHPVRLKDPLGDRIIIDETTSEPIPAERF